MLRTEKKAREDDAQKGERHNAAQDMLPTHVFISSSNEVVTCFEGFRPAGGDLWLLEGPCALHVVNRPKCIELEERSKKADVVLFLASGVSRQRAQGLCTYPGEVMGRLLR
jgi:hypothetical protein